VHFAVAVSGYALPWGKSNPLNHKEKNMKKTIVRIILVTFLLLASGATSLWQDAPGKTAGKAFC
jgi:hypothetical protein